MRFRQEASPPWTCRRPPSGFGARCTRRLAEMAVEPLQARIVEIEAKLTLSEDLLETLNRTVYRQQQLIDRLQQEVRALRDQVEAADARGAPNTPQDEVPPHY